MKGTEKQVKWASEIRENVIRSLEFVKKNSPSATQAEAQKRIDLLNDVDVYAGDIISLFQDIRFGVNEMENAQSVMVVYNHRTFMPNTPGERHLLCM